MWHIMLWDYYPIHALLIPYHGEAFTEPIYAFTFATNTKSCTFTNNYWDTLEVGTVTVWEKQLWSPGISGQFRNPTPQCFGCLRPHRVLARAAETWHSTSTAGKLLQGYNTQFGEKKHGCGTLNHDHLTVWYGGDWRRHSPLSGPSQLELHRRNGCCAGERWPRPRNLVSRWFLMHGLNGG